MDLPYRNRQLTVLGIVYRPETEKFIECYVDAIFAGGWDQSDDDNAEHFITLDKRYHQQHLNDGLYVILEIICYMDFHQT